MTTLLEMKPEERFSLDLSTENKIFEQFRNGRLTYEQAIDARKNIAVCNSNNDRRNKRCAGLSYCSGPFSDCAMQKFYGNLYDMKRELETILKLT